MNNLSAADIALVAEQKNFNPTIKEVRQILEMYPKYQKIDPTANWVTVVEELLYALNTNKSTLKQWKKSVTFWTNKGNVTKMINVTEVALSTTKEKEIIRDFNKNTRVTEWVGGNTYWLANNRLIKSSSLDELQEMHKCVYLNLPVQSRVCFFNK